MVVRDQMRREIRLKNPPQRIVSLVPSQTELLCYLHLEDFLVGVTKFCVHPAHIRKKSKVVGGTKQVYMDRILALQPDIILCNKEENTSEMVRELEKIAPVHVSDVIKFNDVLELIFMYGEIFNIQELTARLIEELEQASCKFKSERSTGQKNVLYFIWKDPWMVAGSNTFINSMLELNGWNNLAKGKNSRYPEIDLQDLGSLQPDIVLLSSEPYPFQEKHKEEIEKNYRGMIELVDGEYFSWYGSRLLPAFEYFKQIQMKLSMFL